MFPRGILVNRSQVVSQDALLLQGIITPFKCFFCDLFQILWRPSPFFLVTLNYTTFGAQTLLNERTRVRRLMQMNIIVLKKL